MHGTQRSRFYLRDEHKLGGHTATGGRRVSPRGTEGAARPGKDVCVSGAALLALVLADGAQQVFLPPPSAYTTSQWRSCKGNRVC